MQVPRQHAALPKPPADVDMQESYNQPVPSVLLNDAEETLAKTPSQPVSSEYIRKKDNIDCDHALASDVRSPEPAAAHEASVQH